MPPPKNIDADDLNNLMKRAVADDDFRDRLITAAGPLLDELDLGARAKWAPYFQRLTPENFVAEITDKISSDPTGEAEAEA